jgi:hypothetical protein
MLSQSHDEYLGAEGMIDFETSLLSATSASSCLSLRRRPNR